jgi:hypothetical protein
VRLVPMGKPTFPDRQQDLQNAAESRVTRECDGGVKFSRLVVEADSSPILLPDGDSGRLGRFTGRKQPL